MRRTVARWVVALVVLGGGAAAIGAGGCGGQASDETVGSTSQAWEHEHENDDATVDAKRDVEAIEEENEDVGTCRHVELTASPGHPDATTVAPPMSFTLPSHAEIVSGHGGPAKATFTFEQGGDAASAVACTYKRAGGSHPSAYHLDHCTNGAQAGDTETADHFALRLGGEDGEDEEGDDHHGNVIELELDESPPCGARDAAADAPSDVREGAADAADVQVDVGADAPVDAPVDAAVDVGADAPSCTPTSCNTNNPCVVDTCQPDGTCTHSNKPAGTSCSTNACAPATCNGSGTCVAGPPVVCTALDQCHVAGTCDPATGVCSNPPAPNGTSCNPGNACIQGATCQNGACTGTPVMCTASDQCHVPGVCDPSTGVCSNPSAPDGTICNDGNACTQTDACMAGTCIGSNPVVCTASDQCHVAGTCDPATGVCSNPATSDGTTCNDNNACTQTDTCQSGTCTGSNPVVCTASDQCHVAGTCDPATGTCSNPNAPNSTACTDNNACTVGDACQNGSCAPGTPVTCTAIDRCHTAGTCDPTTGVCSNPAIPNCDANPTQSSGAFEPNASLMGKIVDTNGNPFIGYTLQVFDAPAGATPRSDLSLTTAADGSFRARLTQFPTSEPDRSPPHHVILIISSSSIIPAMRDAYLHPGDADDLGSIMVTVRDPNVSVIGTAGGTAIDSQNLIEVDIPAGALASPTPITVTAIPVREAIPFPLPDGTATTYAMELEPSGTQFSQPVTVRVANTLNLPTELIIPVGAVDRTNARWIHQGFATWDGQRFAFTTTHFTDVDVNVAWLGGPVGSGGPGPDPGGGGGDGCGPGGGGAPPHVLPEARGGSSGDGGGMGGLSGVGSRAQLASGSLRETIALPSYRRMDRDYRVTLAYDSFLTFGTTSSSVPSTSYAAVPHSTVSARVRGLDAKLIFVGHPTADEIATTSLSSCSTVPVPLPTGMVLPQQLTLEVDGLGSSQTQAITLPAGATDVELSAPVNIPLTSAGDLPAPHFERQTLTLHATQGGVCVSGGGGPFGAQVASLKAVDLTNGTMVTPIPPVSTLQLPGPLMNTFERHVFLNHRHASPFGVGWAIAEMAHLYRDASADLAALAHGNGYDETFLPRTTTTLLLSQGTVGRTLAHDHATTESFLVSANGEIDRINADGTTTPVLTGLGFDSAPHAADITYVAGVRHFVVALATRLIDIDASGNVRTLMTRSLGPDSLFTAPGVAARNDLAVYSAGDASNPVLYRFRLSNASPTAEPLSLASGGDLGLDPRSPLGQCGLGDPHGLAYGPSGALYIADRQRNVVYQALPDASGEISVSSAVVRVLGDGVGRTIAQAGYRTAGPHFSVSQPVLLSVSDDGTLWILNPFGAAAYDPQAQEARWLVLDSTVPGSELEYKLTTPGATVVASAMGLGPSSFFLYDGTSLLRLDIALSSELEPTRTVSFSPSGATVVDTIDNFVEAYDTAGRLVEHQQRTGEVVFSVTYADPTSDRVAQITDVTGAATVFSYDGNGHLASITDGAGRTTQVQVTASGDLLQVTKPDGEVTSFLYDAHRMTQKTTPNGDITTYTFAADGSLQTAVKPAGETTTLTAAYSAPAQRDAGGKTFHGGSYADPHGVTHTFTVDFYGNLATDSYTASGVSYQVLSVPASLLAGNLDGYTDRRNVIARTGYTQINGLDVGLENGWDAQGRLFQVTSGHAPVGIAGSLDFFMYNTFDSNGFLAGYLQKPGDDNFVITRDAAGHPIRIQEFISFSTPEGREVDYTWNANGEPATYTEHGVTTTYTYDPTTGNLLSTVDTLGRTSTFTLDAAGNVASANDGATTNTFTYDAVNRLVTSADALSNTTTYSYTLPSCGCSQDDLVTSVHTPDLPAGVAWTMQYGLEGRLASVTDPDGHPESYAYETTGELRQLFDRNGHLTSFTHDQLGRVSSIVDALSRAHARVYPVETATQWLGPSLLSGSASSTAASTDLTASLNAGDYQIGTNGYDAFGVGVSETRSRGEPQVSLYRDATFQLSYGLGWDQAPRLVRREDRNNLPISSTQAFNGIPGSPDTGANFEEQTAYDALLPAPLVGGQASTYANHVESSSLTYTTEYDVTQLQGWSTGPGPSIAYGGVSAQAPGFTRDVAGRLISVTGLFLPGTQVGSEFVGPTSTYAYYPNGKLRQLVDPDGEHDYVYDTRGLLESITIPGEGVYTFSYDALERNNSLTYPDGHQRTQQYDNEGRIISRCYEYLNGAPSRCYTAEYDAVGNPVFLTDPEGSDTLTYDALNRLTQVSRSNGVVEDYTYNSLGALSVNAGVLLDMQRPRLDGAGLADSAVPNTFNGLPVVLDGGGRITSLNGATLVYNKRNQLEQVIDGATTETYGFDGFMRRIARINNQGVEEYYAYNTDPGFNDRMTAASAQVVGSQLVSTVNRAANSLTPMDVLAPQNIVAVLDSSGGVVKSWLYDGVDHPLRMKTSASTTYYELDLAGNVRRLRDNLGNDLGGYRYTAFGESYPADATTPTPAITQPLQWKARWFSSLAGGIYDVRARQWAPGMGAFTAIDTLESQDSTTTLWGWPGESPRRHLDPTGHQGTPCGGPPPPYPCCQPGETGPFCIVCYTPPEPQACSCVCYKKGVGPNPIGQKPDAASCAKACSDMGYPGYKCGGKVIWPP